MGKLVRELVSDLFGWFLVVLGTFVLGFCAGYMIGHGHVVAFDTLMIRLLFAPLMWIAYREVLPGYVVMWFAWYLPIRHDTDPVRIAAALANFLVWMLLIWYIVVRTANDKFLAF